jgi:diadenosine tetraphosphate (Ap4A) HIT family hydrolase
VFREDFHIAVFYDKYPCTPGHLLFVPKYNSMELLNDAFEDAVREGKRMVEAKEWDGFNVGLNQGEAAGQTVMWPHIHLIPRRKGDVQDPVGGVRNTIPGKGNYKSPNYRTD